MCPGGCWFRAISRDPVWPPGSSQPWLIIRGSQDPDFFARGAPSVCPRGPVVPWSRLAFVWEQDVSQTRARRETDGIHMGNSRETDGSHPVLPILDPGTHDLSQAGDEARGQTGPRDHGTTRAH